MVASLEFLLPKAGKLTAFVKVEPDDIERKSSFVRDVRNIGHDGTGDLEITLSSAEDLEKARPPPLKSYEASWYRFRKVSTPMQTKDR